MDNLTSILEEEFALAFTVKDEKALKRSLTLLTGSMMNKEEYRKESNTLSSEINTLSSDVKVLAARMEEGFKQMGARMESLDARFNRLTGLISLGFLVITLLITLFQFLS